MTASVPTFSQIRAQVAAIRKQPGFGQARVFGIQSPARYTGETRIRFGDDLFEVVQCDSELAMRVALQEQDDEVTAKVLVTRASTDQLSADVRVRLARRKVYTIKKWQIVKELFQARALDPRISGQQWIAEKLLEFAPPNQYASVPGGILDAETVWGILLEKEIGLPIVRPDLIALLKWSLDANNVSKLCSASQEFRASASTWLAQSSGIATDAVLTCLKKSGKPIALSVGLSLGVVSHPNAEPELKLAKVRIEERYLESGKLTDAIAEQWSKAATTLVKLHLPDAKERRDWLTRGDDLLRDVDAQKWAYLSRTSLLGFEQRLDHYGQAVGAAAEARITEVPTAVSEAFEFVVDHEQANWERGSRRLARVEMSARLLRWLAGQEASNLPPFSSLGQAATWYAGEGGFVDWARYVLQSGEPARKLADAYNKLVSQVIQTRSEQNHRFAVLVRDWTQAGSTGSAVLPVERVLDEFVAPLAELAPLLVLVMDGMSYAVFRELVSDITKQDWVELRRGDKQPIWPAIATLPSITEVSRASLLSGGLRQGSQATEKVDFPMHAGLLQHCQPSHPPVLFHKNELQSRDETSLSDEVIKAIESKRRIVGAVINAVDDFLLKGEQLDIRWSKDEIKILPQLLYEAKSTGRLVVLLSDHGHVLDRETKQIKSEGGERWRAGSNPTDGEIAISGDRCVLPESHELIVPWSEKIRYGIKKNGYHGGVTMQEMLAPMAVLSARDDLPDGWIEPPSDTPGWWFEPVALAPMDQSQEPDELLVVAPPNGFLFDIHVDETAKAKADSAKSAANSQPIAIWITRLLDSSVFHGQKKLAGRKPPSDELIRTLLSALDQQGGKLTSAALARSMNVPLFRLSTILAAIQRVLNVEGYSILLKDDASDTVEIKRELLCIQFGIALDDEK